MVNKIIFFLLLSLSGFLNAQNKYPTDYFINPLEIPLVLSGTFGELRSNHFHAGLDLKTQKQEGLKVLASGSGYVSRIKISHWGYGKAIYITHPNGYTSVYGHLREFSPKIESYVKKHQYEKENFTIQLYPKSDELKIDQGELIALSGNSGSSGGPHLHFEIRDTKAKPINPMLFGIKIPDHKSPTIKNVVVYAASDTSHVNRSNNSVDLVIERQENGDLIANQIYAYGKIGIGVNAVDKLDGAINNNGIYDLQMDLNGKRVFQYTVNTYSFEESRYINDFIDYERFALKKQRIQRCFVKPGNALSIYENLINKGFIHIKDSLDYKIKITASDFEGNKTNLIIPVRGKKDSIVHFKKIKKTPYYFKADQFNKISDSIVIATFPKGAFYDDLYFDYSYKDGVAIMHNNTVPLHKSFSMSFNISKYDPKEVKYLFIARKNKYGRLYYSPTKRKDNKLFTSSKNLGEYMLVSDYDKPKIAPLNFKDKQWLTKHRYLKINISDKGSGIKSYRGEIDGKWVLMEFKPKKGYLVYDFNDNKLSESSEHTLKVEVVDNVNNTSTFTATFFRK